MPYNFHRLREVKTSRPYRRLDYSCSIQKRRVGVHHYLTVNGGNRAANKAAVESLPRSQTLIWKRSYKTEFFNCFLFSVVTKITRTS